MIHQLFFPCFSLPTVLKRGRICPYFLRGNHTLFEYEPLELVFEKESKWQNIKIYKTQSFGNILCLNEDLSKSKVLFRILIYLQSTLAISTSVISNNRLSRNKILVPVLT